MNKTFVHEVLVFREKRLLDDFSRFRKSWPLCAVRTSPMKKRLRSRFQPNSAAKGSNGLWSCSARILPTFITDPLLSQDEREDETNLLYVAVTRARRTLVLNELMGWLSNEREKNRETTHETVPYGNEERDNEQPAPGLMISLLRERALTGTKKREKLLRVSNWFFMVKRGECHNTGQPYTRRKSCATESGP